MGAQGSFTIDGATQRKSTADCPLRIGIGHDTHRTGPGDGLRLGGVDVPHDRSMVGHSDADVLLHAITDAILGAAATGDIGELFPDTNATFKDKNSEFFLNETLNMLNEKNYSIVNMDCVIHLEKPKLKSYKTKIKENLARLLKMKPEALNIKAKTREKVDAVGKGDAIEALVSVLIAKDMP